MKVYDVWLNLCLGVAVKNAQDINNLSLSPKEIFDNRKDLEKFEVFLKPQIKNLENIDLKMAEKILKIHTENNINSINYTDEKYPDSLRDLEDMPLVLYYKGDINLLNSKKIVGIIGTRNPDRNGIKITSDTAKEIALKGGIVLSGLAQGIDSLSQKTALSNKGKVIAVVGLPLNEYYPKANRNLQEDIAREGLVISEVPATQNIVDNKYIFVQRNRLIASLSNALVLIEAKIPSGTATTINFAIDMGREVFAIPGSVFDPLMEFNNKLLSEGIVRCTVFAKNVLEFLNIENNKIEDSKIDENLSEYEKAILKELDNKILTANQIFTELKIPMPVLKAMLTNLEMEGFIKQQSMGVYQRV